MSTPARVCHLKRVAGRDPLQVVSFLVPFNFVFPHMFSLTRPSNCSRHVPFPGRELFAEHWSAGCRFTATSLALGTSETAGFDRGQFDASE